LNQSIHIACSIEGMERRIDTMHGNLRPLCLHVLRSSCPLWHRPLATNAYYRAFGFDKTMFRYMYTTCTLQCYKIDTLIRYKTHTSLRDQGSSSLGFVIRQAKDPPHLHIPFPLERSRARHILVTYLFISMSMSMAVSTTLAFQAFYSSKDRPLHIT